MSEPKPDIIIDIDAPWHLTRPMPAEVRGVIDGEREVTRQYLVDVIRRTRRTSIGVVAALQALADTASWALVQGETEQARLGVPPRFALDLESVFATRFRNGLIAQRRHRDSIS